MACPALWSGSLVVLADFDMELGALRSVATVSVPLSVLRLLEVALTCVSFSLVASVGNSSSSYWAWCMFSWCFCCFLTLLILVLEFARLSACLPISWDDFTIAFAMLAALMLLAASIIYPSVVFSCPGCARQVAASVTSCLAFLAYCVEVGVTRAQPGQVSGFLSTVPGLLKVLEAFVACIIFISLEPARVSAFPGLQWCVAVYALAFIFSLLIIILTVGRLLGVCPCPLEQVLVAFNVLAVLMYATAVIVWPVYAFRNNPRPSNCRHCPWDGLVVVSFMTCVNLLAYIVDTVYSVRLVFFITPS
ncbi:myeloid-associated differentiation marker homolog [Clupea harengus]|uniref:Myeloid-associated differentiation marker homolog n=1 Tax=Clupea harengus TaxID=7950 RepID=A0A8M1K7H9_CLUHA|nr:myeloid-associated differentiation marker homolog [Clupea harengus]